MPRVGGAKGRNAVAKRAAFKPIGKLGLDPRWPVMAALAGDDEDDPGTIHGGIVKRHRQHRMGISERVTMQIDDAIGADLAAPQPLVPAAIEGGGGDRRCRAAQRWWLGGARDRSRR